ncbi:MAG: PIN domain-containing protein [Anaerolineae bacterium]
MKRRPRVYLDTSVISALFDESSPERKSLTEAFFKELKNFEVFISEITVAEIKRTLDLELRSKMEEVLPLFSIAPLTDEVEWLTKEYIRYGAVPESYPEDAHHIAIAVVNGMDYLLSWNFRHIVRRKTKDIVRMVNTLNNLRQIEIMTPPELL